MRYARRKNILKLGEICGFYFQNFRTVDKLEKDFLSAVGIEDGSTTSFSLSKKLSEVMRNGFDAIFLDAFTPDTNPELWTSDFIAELKNHLLPHGRIATYCSAYPVRGALIENGLTVQESPAFGRKRGGTVGVFSPAADLSDLPEKEWNITVRSTAGTPYRDPSLSGSREEILQRHTGETGTGAHIDDSLVRCKIFLAVCLRTAGC